MPCRPATDASALADEVRFSIDLVALLVRDARARLRGDGSIGSVPEGERAKLGAELDTLSERSRALWLARNRPGGLEDSQRWLQNLRDAYASGQADPCWGGLDAPADR